MRKISFFAIYSYYGSVMKAGYLYVLSNWYTEGQGVRPQGGASPIKLCRVLWALFGDEIKEMSRHFLASKAFHHVRYHTSRDNLYLRDKHHCDLLETIVLKYKKLQSLSFSKN